MSERRPKKPLKVQPKAVARKSQSERDALAKEAEKRLEQRNREAAAEERAEEASRRLKYGIKNESSRGDFGSSRGGTPRGGFSSARAARGGFMGNSTGERERVIPRAAFGRRNDRPAPTVKMERGTDVTEEVLGGRDPAAMIEDDDIEEGPSTGRRAVARGRGMFKGEPADEDPAEALRRVSARREDLDEGYVREIEEEGIDVENLPYIVISSDEDEVMTDQGAEGEDGGSSTKARTKAKINMMPVRLQREEHKERVVGVNTDATSESLAKPRRRAGRAVRVEDDSEDDTSEDEQEPAEEPLSEKQRGKRPQPRKPGQTAEEALEDQIRMDELATIARELYLNTPNRNNMYLWQIPPKLPPLVPMESLVKKERSSTSPERRRTDKMDIDDDTAKGKEDDKKKATAGPSYQRSGRLQIPPGKIGKLRVYESGRTEISWGGISMKLGVGIDASFLQTVVILSPHETDAEGYGGTATAMGQIRGSFIMTPDWDKILAAEKAEKAAAAAAARARARARQ